MLYVPSIVKKEIQYPAIGKGEPFTITTAEKKSGTLRIVKWLITASDTRVPIGAPANKDATSQTRTGTAAGASTDAPSATNRNGLWPRSASEPKGFLVAGLGNRHAGFYCSSGCCCGGGTILCNNPNGAPVHFRICSRKRTKPLPVFRSISHFGPEQMRSEVQLAARDQAANSSTVPARPFRISGIRLSKHASCV